MFSWRGESTGAGGRSLLLFLELLGVEFELSAFNNVTIKTAGLAWAGRDGGEKTAGVELISEFLVENASLLDGCELSLDGATGLGRFTCFIRFFKLLLVEFDVVLLQVPRSEGGGIDDDNAILDEGLGTDELVIGSVVDNIENTGLGSHGFGAPGEVTGVVPESTALDVVAASADVDDLLGAKLGHSGHSTHFELSLFLMDWHTATRCSPLVPRVPRNTHTS